MPVEKPVLCFRRLPPDPVQFRRTPVWEWALSETEGTGAAFTSSLFADDDTQAALQILSSVLFSSSRPERPAGGEEGRPCRPPTQADTGRGHAVLENSTESRSRTSPSPAGGTGVEVCGGGAKDLTFSFLNSQKGCDEIMKLCRGGAKPSSAQGKVAERTGMVGKIGGATTKAVRGGGARVARRVDGAGADDALALSDDDFDFVFSKHPLPKKPIHNNLADASFKRIEDGVSSGVSAKADVKLNNKQGLEKLPSNHYEQMWEKGEASAQGEEDPWDRAILPPDASENTGPVHKGKDVSDGRREANKGQKAFAASGGRGEGIVGSKKQQQLAPFFGGGGKGEGGGEERVKEREQNKCSLCGQPGHSKRTCPSAEEGTARSNSSGAVGGTAGGGEKKRKSKSKGEKEEEEAPQSLQEKLASLSSVATNAGLLCAESLDDLLQRMAACSCICFGVVFTNSDSNLREKPRKGSVAKEPLGCCLLLTDEKDERAANIFVPFLQISGFTTTVDERRKFLQKVFSPAIQCPLVCFHARPCLLALVQFVLFRSETFSEAAVCCLHVAQWILDPDNDPANVDFDKFVLNILSITPFEDRIGGERGVLKDHSVPMASTVDANFWSVLFQDLTLCAQMWEIMAEQLRERSMEGATALEMALIPVIVMMEDAGIGFSPSRLIKERRAMERKLIQLEEEATRIMGHPVLLTSPQQLCSVLFEELRLPPPKNEGLHAATAANSTSKFKGANQTYSTNEEVLTGLVDMHPLPAIVLEHRHIAKMLGGFVVPLCERAVRAVESSSSSCDGVSTIQTHWSQTSTATGRLSSSEPNLQNVPKQESVRFGNRTDMTKEMNVRNAFVPRNGTVLLSIDYVQCELRIMAHFSQDPALLTLLHGDSCPYTGIAARIQNKHVSAVTARERSIYKTVVLGLLYGQGQKSLATKLNMSESQAASTISTFFNSFPKVRDFKLHTQRQAKVQGYVTTLSGRRRSFPDVLLQGNQSGFKRALAERQAVNFVIQGSASDFIKSAMKDITMQLCAHKLAEKCCCCLQIHDELVFEVDPSALAECAALVSKSMIECVKLRVPMRVKVQVGRRWGDLVALEDAHLLFPLTENIVPRPLVDDAAERNEHVRGTMTALLGVTSDISDVITSNHEDVASLQSEPTISSSLPLQSSATESALEENRGAACIAWRAEAEAEAETSAHVSGHRAADDSEEVVAKKRHRDSLDAVFGALAKAPSRDTDFESFRKRSSQAQQQHAVAKPKPVSPPVPQEPGLQVGIHAEERGRDRTEYRQGHESKAEGGSIASEGSEEVHRQSRPLREIALSGLNLNPLRANRLVGRPMVSRFTSHKPLSAALLDDDTDQLDLDC